MILILSDTHCRYDVVNEQIAHAEGELKCAVSSVIVIGDFGLFGPELKAFFRKKRERFSKPLYFIEGNHEDYPHFASLKKEYADCFTHLPRSSVQVINDIRFLAFGGAAYMDAMTTPRAAVIADDDIDQALTHPANTIDVVLSHDCPKGIGVTSTPGFEHYGAPGFKRGDEIAARYHPKLWFSGHHHKWYDKTIDGVRYLGLGESWDGFALLGPNSDLRIINHHIPRLTLTFGAWLRRLFGIAKHPDCQ